MTDMLTCAAEHGHIWYFIGGVVCGLIGRIILIAAVSGSSNSWDD